MSLSAQLHRYAWLFVSTAALLIVSLQVINVKFATCVMARLLTARKSAAIRQMSLSHTAPSEGMEAPLCATALQATSNPNATSIQPTANPSVCLSAMDTARIMVHVRLITTLLTVNVMCRITVSTVNSTTAINVILITMVSLQCLLIGPFSMSVSQLAPAALWIWRISNHMSLVSAKTTGPARSAMFRRSVSQTRIVAETMEHAFLVLKHVRNRKNLF
jgi:hypothetical protein